MSNNQNINFSLGNNALDILNNGAGFLGKPTNKFYAEKLTADIPSGFESAAWLMEFADDLDNQIPITEPFTLDDILDGKVVNENTVTEILLDSPVASPLSSSDESTYDLDDILFSASPEDVLASTTPSSPVPLAEHMYAVTNPTLVPMPKNDVPSDLKGLLEFNAPCPDQTSNSGFNSSGEDSVIDSGDLLTQLLSGAYDFNTLESELVSEQPLPSTIDENALSFGFEVTPTNEMKVQAPAKVEESLTTPAITVKRAKPYTKKQRTQEQKLRKKAQNRTAASRYRNKKNTEMEEMFKVAEELEGKNKDLHTKVNGLKTEINYLKKLMLDVIKARLSNGGSLPEELNATALLGL